MTKIKRNLALLVPILTILAMGFLVSCGNESEGGSSGASSSNVPVTSVTLDKTSATIYVGGSITLTATVAPSNASNKNVTWSSDSDAVATVNASGEVTAVSAGTAIITVKTNDGSHTATATITITPLAETMVETIPASFTIPNAGIKFPMNSDDSGAGTINHKFVMAKTEVTYELWKKVYDWATDSARGANQYAFANAGKEGNDGTAGAAPTTAKNEPVTTVSWRDGIVWCNAYTEWSNATQGTSYTVVYYTDAAYTTPLRTSTNGTVPNPLSSATAGSEDKPYIKASSNGNTDMANNLATGFRLPTSAEWEFAARLRKDSTNTVANGKPSGVTYPISIGGTSYWFTKGNSASGGSKAYNASPTDIGDFAWYTYNSCDDGTGCSIAGNGAKKSKTQDVASKAPNALGLYDMSGNVWEWTFTFDGSGSSRVFVGGSSLDNYIPAGGFKRGRTVHPNTLMVSSFSYDLPTRAKTELGFRVAQTSP